MICMLICWGRYFFFFFGQWLKATRAQNVCYIYEGSWCSAMKLCRCARALQGSFSVTCLWAIHKPGKVNLASVAPVDS